MSGSGYNFPNEPRLGLPQLLSVYPFAADEPAALLELTFGQVLAARGFLEKLPKARLVVFAPDETREAWARGCIESAAARTRFFRADPAAAGWEQKLPDGFHFICISWGLEEVVPQRRSALVKKLAEKLRPGGVLAVLAAVDPPAELLKNEYARALRAAGVEDSEKPPVANKNAPTEGQLRFWLEAAALKPVDLYWKHGPFTLHFGMRAV